MKETNEFDPVIYSKKIYAILQPSGWGDVLKPFLYSSEFYKILEELKQLQDTGVRFAPALKYMFSPFTIVNVKDIRSIMLTDLPILNGAETSNSAFAAYKHQTNEFMVVLRSMFSEVKSAKCYGRKSFIFLNKQGVLAIPLALTTPIYSNINHIKLWKPFIDYILYYLSSTEQVETVALFGEKAQNYGDLFDDVYNIDHPRDYVCTYTTPVLDTKGYFKRLYDMGFNYD